MSNAVSDQRMNVEQLVGHHMRLLRESVGHTQEELGRRLGNMLGRPWSRQSVSLAEMGRRGFTAAELFAIATLLRVEVGALFVPPEDVFFLQLPSGYAVETSHLDRALGLPENETTAATTATAETQTGNALTPDLTQGPVTLDEIKRWPAVVDLKAAARALGIGITKAYGLAKNDTFPVHLLRLGGTYKVSTAELVSYLHPDSPR